MPFCSLARIRPTSFSVASLPIESTPLFSSDGISTEWVLFPSSGDYCNSETAGASGWSPRTWNTYNLGLHAEDAAPRSDVPRDSEEFERVRPRRKRPDLVPHPAGYHATARGADPSLNSQTCSLRATPACCKFSSTAPRAAIACVPFLVLPESLENYAHGHAYWNQDPG